MIVFLEENSTVDVDKMFRDHYEAELREYCESQNFTKEQTERFVKKSMKHYGEQ